MKKYTAYILLALLLSSCGFSSYSSKKGNFYRCTLVDDFEARKIEKIGVFAYSNTEIFQGMELSDAADVYPQEITLSTTFKSNTELNGPSKELSINISNYLSDNGYKAKEMKDLSVGTVLSVDSIVNYGLSKGFHAVFVVNYAAVANYYSDASKIIVNPFFVKSTGLTINFLYLPNAALIECSTKKILWSSTYYGIVENSHVFNPLITEYTKVIEKALVEYNGIDYFKAAEKVVDLFFAPKYFPKSAKIIPLNKLKKLKI